MEPPCYAFAHRANHPDNLNESRAKQEQIRTERRVFSDSPCSEPACVRLASGHRQFPSLAAPCFVGELRYTLLSTMMAGCHARRIHERSACHNDDRWSNSGKTTFTTRVVELLTGMGIRVGVIKHHGHKTGGVDVEGKDSWKYAQAGANPVILSASDQYAIFVSTPQGRAIARGARRQDRR